MTAESSGRFRDSAVAKFVYRKVRNEIKERTEDTPARKPSWQAESLLHEWAA